MITFEILFNMKIDEKKDIFHSLPFRIPEKTYMPMIDLNYINATA